jgi:hypothetical protein
MNGRFTPRWGKFYEKSFFHLLFKLFPILSDMIAVVAYIWLIAIVLLFHLTIIGYISVLKLKKIVLFIRFTDVGHFNLIILLRKEDENNDEWIICSSFINWNLRIFSINDQSLCYLINQWTCTCTIVKYKYK